MAQNSDDIRYGDVRWQGLLNQWETEKRPGQVILGNTTYLVLQDPETGYRYFRPIGAEGQYSTRSF